MIIVFIYNILLIVLYTIAFSFSISAYLREKKKLFLIFILYLAFFILDNTIIYMTEFINSFANSYNQIFMSIPAAKTLIFIVNAFCSFWIIDTLFKEKIKPLHLGIIITMSVWMMFIPILPDSAFMVWLYYLPTQLMMIYLGCFIWFKYKKQTNLSPLSRYYLKRIAVICFFFGIFILLEDTFVIFNVDQYRSLPVRIYNRNISEDIFSIVVCLLMIKYFTTDHQSVEKSDSIRTKQSEDTLIQLFIQQYQLTQREGEILNLLLDYKHNQEIADELFLSVGTVKTHIHNIFIKLDVNKRNQICIRFKDFKSETVSLSHAKK